MLVLEPQEGKQWGENIKAFSTEDKYKIGRRALYGGGAQQSSELF